MGIEVDTIATNRYAPEGANAINLYNNGEGRGLTFGQLVMSVSLRTAAAYETQSVLKMNKMTSGSVILEEGAGWLRTVADGSANWNAAKAFATGKLGVAADTLPDGLDSYDKRMQAANAIKAKLDTLAQTQQEEMIDLQTLVNRRDVAYSTSSNVISALGNSTSADAANYL